MSSFQDVNGDGRLDLVVHVTTSALQLTQTDILAVVKGKTNGGVSIKGTDTVRVVPKNPGESYVKEYVAWMK